MWGAKGTGLQDSGPSICCGLLVMISDVITDTSKRIVYKADFMVGETGFREGSDLSETTQH